MEAAEKYQHGYTNGRNSVLAMVTGEIQVEAPVVSWSLEYEQGYNAGYYAEMRAWPHQPCKLHSQKYCDCCLGLALSVY